MSRATKGNLGKSEGWRNCRSGAENDGSQRKRANKKINNVAPLSAVVSEDAEDDEA